MKNTILKETENNYRLVEATNERCQCCNRKKPSKVVASFNKGFIKIIKLLREN
jgi:hypothetical protein